MTTLRILASRLLDGLRRHQRDARLDEEIGAHLDALRDDFVARGCSPGDAEAAARRAFGGVDQVKARYRDQRGWPWMESVSQDARFAVRYLARDRAFSVPLLLVLALGLGVGHLFFTLTYAATRRGLPIVDVDRVLFISAIDAKGQDRPLAYPDFADLSRAQRTFAALAAYAAAPMTVGERGEVPDRVEGAYASATGFGVAGVRAIAGRILEPDDDRFGAPVTTVLTERVWRGPFGGDPGIVGRPVLVNGSPATVIGVISDRSGYPSTAAVFLPLAARPQLAASGRGDRVLRVFGRLAPHSGPADAAADLASIGETFATGFAETHAGTRLHAVPINARLLPNLAGWLPFLTAGLLVLAVASTNAGNLMLAAAASRAREFAVRTSLGATRGRVVRQLLVESLTVAAMAAVGGMALSRLGVALFQSWVPDGALPYWFDFSLDRTVFTALWLLAFATIVVFALTPALRASRTAVVEVMKDGGRTETSRPRRGLAATLFMAVQLGLAVVLVAQVGVAAMVRDDRLRTDPLLADGRVLTGTLTLSSADYGAAEQRRAFQRRLLEQIDALPGVSAAALAGTGPLEGFAERNLVLPTSVETTRPRVHVMDVSADYFAVLGTGAIRGRVFADIDGVAGEPVVIVNERLAALHLPGVDPVGQRLALQDPGERATPMWRTIVAVVPDIRHRPDRPAAVPVAYSPMAAVAPATAVLFVRGVSDGPSLTAEVRRTLRALDANVPFYRARSLPVAVRDATWVGRVSATLGTAVSIAAFALAAFGLFAVVSHRVALRHREIGLRISLGAEACHIATLVVRTVGGAVALGFVLGLLGVAAWDRAFAPAGADGRGVNPGTLAAVVAALLVTVLVGCFVPASRAAQIVPAEVLRRE